MPQAEIDGGQFQQVFYNLLRNAYQALSGESGRIAIRSRFNDYEYVISIEDNGSGISPEHMGAIFEPYRTTKEEDRGTRVIIHLPRAERTVRLLGSPETMIEVD
ncbi:MAG: ATP-binding protein [Akkermansiaceae bacterium]|nr:ATP-binding protein [Akkermansiaceae bacterium]